MATISASKRIKEKNRLDRQRDKAAKRVEKSRNKDDRSPGESGEDPDIAGIVPGPQPLPEGFEDP